MTSNELRLGNIINNGKEAGWGAKDGYAVVESIQEDRINEWHDMGASGSLSIKEVKPMPINAEWLERMRFKHLISNWFVIELNANRCELMYNTSSHYTHFKDFYGQSYLRTCEYVHEIQNLFYILASKELLIQP